MITREKWKKRDKLDTHNKELLKKIEKKERENWAITLMIRKENRWKKVTKLERKKEISDNLDGNKKGELKNLDNRKEKRDNLNPHEKELLKNYEKR